MSLKKDIVTHLLNKNLPTGKAIFSKPGRPTGSSPSALAAVVCTIKHTTALSDLQILRDDVVTDAGNDGGIDAIHFDPDSKSILIYDVKSGGGGFGERDINDLIRTIEDNIMDTPTRIRGLHDLVKRKIDQARDYYLNHDWKVKLIFARPLHNRCLEGREPRMLQDFRQTYPDTVEQKCLCLNHFITLLTQRKEKNSRTFDLRFDHRNVITSNVPRRIQDRPSVAIGTIRLADLVNMRHVLGDIVFDDNIRLDREDDDLSEEILKTLKNNPQDFCLYHNGFTISCDDIRPKGRRDFRLLDPQVINGCQSLSAIYRASRSPSQPISAAQLNRATALCRIYGHNSRKLIEAICQSTNTQKKIDPWDLRTNDEIIKIIDIYLSTYGFVRKRKGRSHEGFLLPELTQWIYACKYGRPAAAKNKKKDLFNVLAGDQSLYHRKIYNDEKLTITQLKRVVSIGLLVNRQISRERRRNVKRMLKYADFHVMTALYRMRDYKGRRYRRVVEALKLIVRRQQRRLGDEFSYNKVFTKTNDVWFLLRQRLRIR